MMHVVYGFTKIIKAKKIHQSYSFLPVTTHLVKFSRSSFPFLCEMSHLLVRNAAESTCCLWSPGRCSELCRSVAADLPVCKMLPG